MNKRALMLTAASAALMSGPAFATCPATAPNWTNITTAITVPVDTACANQNAPGTITIATNGSVSISTSPFTSPAVTIDSGTTTAPGLVTNTGVISYTGVTSATGVELLATGNTGAIINGTDGTIDLTGSGTTKIGILVGMPTGATTGTFTGTMIVPPDPLLANTPYQSDLVAIDLQATSTLKVEGTGSFGIESVSGTTLNGDIDIGGALTMTPTSTTSTTTSENDAIFLGGQLNGNLIVETGGTIESVGDGASGIVVSAPITGAIVDYGTISAVGTTTPTGTSSTSDPEAGTALSIGANVTGGVYIAGPTSISDTTTSRAGVSTAGVSPAILISTSTDITGTAQPTTIGYYADSVLGSTYGLINRGSVSAAPVDPDITTSPTTAISLQGSGPTVGVTVMGGIYNAGAIAANAFTTASGASGQIATGILVGDYATVPLIKNDDSQTTSGTISASVSGSFGGTAFGIEIGPNGSVTEIDNVGVIAASASTTTLTEPSIRAEAIADFSGLNTATGMSGTITNINNTGSIIATTTILNNNQQIARAIDLSGSTQNVDVENTGAGFIQGDIIFGNGINTLHDAGLSFSSQANIEGNIYFGGNQNQNDTLTIGNFATVTGSVFEGQALPIGLVDVTVEGGGTLDLLNSYLPNQPTNTTAKPLNAGDFHIETAAILHIAVTQPFNLNGLNPTTGLSQAGVGAIVQSNTAEIDDNSNFGVTFGSFVESPSSKTVNFALISSKMGDFTVSPYQLNIMATNVDSAIPFLFENTDALCTQNIANSPIACATTTATDSELDLILTPKPATGPGGLGLTGYALTLFPYANAALATDPQLGAGVVAGITNNATAQQVYSSFAPDVSGATRATAISLTDSATDVVAARQRVLRMYANQDGDTTLWGQEFAQRLSQDSTTGTIGYNDTGFGFALGMDSGDPSDGRYGGAFTFFSGRSSTEFPADQKTASEFYLGTFYTDWRGKGLFLDSQLTAGWAHLSGERFIDVGGVSRTADGDRPAAMLSGGLTTGAIFNFGGTVITPQMSLDGLTMREDGYSESGGEDVTGGDGFDLRVQPYYADSARTFVGVDLRQDINFGDFYIQPQLRAGYRYDFLDGAVKLKANFVGVTPIDQFSIEGPDPSKGNIVLGGGFAVTTGAWSVGASYDYLRANSGNTQMDGMLTLLGRI